MSYRLFEVGSRVRLLTSAIYEQADPETGAIPEALHAELEAALAEQESAVLDLACVLKERRGEVDVVRAEAAKLAARAKALAGQCDRLEAAIEAAVPAGEKLRDARVTISWRRSTAVEVSVPPEALPECYQRRKVEADRAAIKAAIEAGRAVPGAALVESMNMQVR